MNRKGKYKRVLAKTSPDGWIKTRKDKHEFAEVTHATRASLTKEFVRIKQEFPVQECVTSPPINQRIKVSISSSNCVSLNRGQVKVDTELVTPPNPRRVNNPYVTSTKRAHQPNNENSTSTKPATEKKSGSVPTLESIKRNNKLYFSYDPRGYKTQPLPKGYCEYCLCPLEYCAELVFGKMTISNALVRVYAPRTTYNTKEKRNMMEAFDDAYTEAVLCKLRWNGFELDAFEVKNSWRALRIPNCMRKRSLRRFWRQVKENNEEEYNTACDKYMNYDEEEEIQKAIINDRFNTMHPIMKRVAAKQSQNIEVMFEKMKNDK